jgi:hypothetical protein
MKKIRLDLDSLKVETFVTNENSGGQGTVFGMDPNTICDWTCNGVSPSCDNGQGCDTNGCDYTLPMETTCYTGGTGGGQSDLGTCETCDESCGEPTCAPCAESCDSVECEPD